MNDCQAYNWVGAFQGLEIHHGMVEEMLAKCCWVC